MNSQYFNKGICFYSTPLICFIPCTDDFQDASLIFFHSFWSVSSVLYSHNCKVVDTQNSRLEPNVLIQRKCIEEYLSHSVPLLTCYTL